MAQLPLKIRVHLRDQWENSDAPIRKSITALEAFLGLDVEIDFQALMVWSKLKKFYPDQDVFVPTMMAIIQAWVDTLHARLKSEYNDRWTDTFLDCFHLNRLDVCVEVRESYVQLHLLNIHRAIQRSQAARVSTILSTSTSGPMFVIEIPEIEPPFSNVASCFESDFAAVFEDSKNSEPMQLVDDGGSSSIAYQPPTTQPSAALPSQEMPSLQSLPRPEILFASTTPYHMIVEIIKDGISVLSSHQASLELLVSYLKKYARIFHLNAEAFPLLEIELHQSNFGSGLLHDRCTIKKVNVNQRWQEISPVLINTFIEGVLHYTAVPQNGSPNQWCFRRDTPFRT